MKQEPYSREYLMIIGEKIKATRELLHVKEDTLAKEALVSRPVMSKIENGKYKSLTVSTIIRLNKFLHIPWDELLPPPPHKYNNIICS